jgi:hypothetical protein
MLILLLHFLDSSKRDDKGGHFGSKWGWIW